MNYRIKNLSIFFLLVGTILLTLGCAAKTTFLNKNQTPISIKQINSPEQTWQIYVEGWKNENIEQILSACSANPQTQERCRKQFEAIKAGGNIQKFAADLRNASLIIDKDLQTIRFYTLTIDGEATTVTFELLENLGWKIKEF